MAFHRQFQQQIRIIRIFNTFGPRMRKNDGRVIPTFVCQALKKEPLSVFGDGSQTRSFCFVEDLIEGMICLMESDLNLPCNIGNPHELSMLQLAEYINEFTGNPAGVILKPLPKDDPTRRRPDLSRAKKVLKWEPRISFEEGIKRTIEWFQNSLH